MKERTSQPVLIITGPTATGKTRIGIEVAKRLGGEIISADSRQVYRLMDIGTAKPALREREEVPHHLIDILNPDQTYSAGLFVRDAQILIEQILNRGNLPIIVGGTGFYIKALIQGIFAGPAADQKIRERLKNEAEHLGIQELYRKLEEIDPRTAAKVTPKDRVRIFRALEIYELTGKPISYWQKGGKKPEFKFTCFGINLDRKKLYERINLRVDKMMQDGFIDEVRNIRDLGYDFNLPALRTFGYMDILNHLEGRITLGEGIARFKQGTRNFAKRQLTWFRHQIELSWIDMDENDPVAIVNQALAAP